MSNKTQRKKVNFTTEQIKNQQKFKIPWLIQRCKIANPPRLHKAYPISQNYEFDYMGSAEFEYGNPFKSIRRIVKSLSEFEIVSTDIQNKSGQHLFLYIRKHMVDQFLPYLNIWKDIRYQELKEQISFSEHVYEEIISFGKEYNIWWDIENDIWFSFGKKTIEKIKKDFDDPLTKEYVNKQPLNNY